MKNKFNKFLSNRKVEIREEGLFICLLVWALGLIAFVALFPFWCVFFFFSYINERSKKWF